MKPALLLLSLLTLSATAADYFPPSDAQGGWRTPKDSAEARAALRDLYLNKALLKSKVVFEKEKDAAKFKDYFDWSEPVAQCPSHRFLAIRRGETEGLLFSRITPLEEQALAALDHLFVKGSHPSAQQVRLAAHDCYKRLLGFAMEGEARVFYKKKADEEAIRVFAENIRELLLASPLGLTGGTPIPTSGIAALLLASPQHLTAEQILCRLREGGMRISKATVYNTLNLFAAKGVIRQLAVDGDRALLHVVEPHEQPGDGALAAAGGADERHG